MADAPTPPFIPARDFTAGGNLPIHRIVIHGTVSGCYCGGAENIARYFQHPTYASSAHYVVDPCSTYQCVNDWDIAWHAPPNPHSIGIEMCDPVSGPDSRWDDDNHQAMLDRTADLTRQLCLAYDVPMVWLYPDDLRAGRHGITDHENVSLAWGQTSHTDPQWSGARSDAFMAKVLNANPPGNEEDDVSYDDAYRAIRDVIWGEKHSTLVDDSDYEAPLGQFIRNADLHSYTNRQRLEAFLIESIRNPEGWASTEKNPTIWAITALQRLYGWSNEMVQNSRVVTPQVNALVDTVSKLAASQGANISADEVKQTLRDAVAANMPDSLNVDGSLRLESGEQQ